MKYDLPLKIKDRLKENYSLSKQTWFQTGGKADYFYQAKDSQDLKNILNILPIDVPIYILGAGSNLLIRDGGFRGIIIKLGKGFNNLNIKNDIIVAGSAILDTTLSKYALQNSIKNLEFLIGIPGKIGGAVKMNSGCFGMEIKDIINGVVVINRNGEEIYLEKDSLNFQYRGSSVDQNTIIKEIFFEVNYGNQKEILQKMNEIINKRELTQPIKTKTGGSTFKNPKGYYASKLIDESNCKGLKVGGAMVSNKHANFIINQDNATAKDIEDLGKIIIDKVKNKFSVQLEWEIKIIGSDI